MMNRNLILIGFMGAGKTTIGLRYASKHGLPIIDTDELIVARGKMSIAQIFEQHGEETFRKLETEVLTELLLGSEPAVISVGGGLPLRPENRQLLSQLGLVVYLDISKEEVLRRLAGDRSRPLLQGDDADKRVDKLLAYRRPIYEQAANRIILVDHKSPEQIVSELELFAAEL